MKQFLRSLPLLNVSLMLLQIMAGTLSIAVAVVAAMFFEPVANATFSAAGFATSAGLSCLWWQNASVRERGDARGRLEAAGYMSTMAAIFFLGTLILSVGLPVIAEVDQNASIIAYWLTKGLWCIAVFYIEAGCLLFCWTVDMFVKMPDE